MGPELALTPERPTRWPHEGPPRLSARTTRSARLVRVTWQLWTCWPPPPRRPPGAPQGPPPGWYGAALRLLPDGPEQMTAACPCCGRRRRRTPRPTARWRPVTRAATRSACYLEDAAPERTEVVAALAHLEIWLDCSDEARRLLEETRSAPARRRSEAVRHPHARVGRTSATVAATCGPWLWPWRRRPEPLRGGAEAPVLEAEAALRTADALNTTLRGTGAALAAAEKSLDEAAVARGCAVGPRAVRAPGDTDVAGSGRALLRPGRDSPQRAPRARARAPDGPGAVGHRLRGPARLRGGTDRRLGTGARRGRGDAGERSRSPATPPSTTGARSWRAGSRWRRAASRTRWPTERWRRHGRARRHHPPRVGDWLPATSRPETLATPWRRWRSSAGWMPASHRSTAFARST